MDHLKRIQMIRELFRGIELDATTRFILDELTNVQEGPAGKASDKPAADSINKHKVSDDDGNTFFPPEICHRRRPILATEINVCSSFFLKVPPLLALEDTKPEAGASGELTEVEAFLAQEELRGRRRRADAGGGGARYLLENAPPLAALPQQPSNAPWQDGNGSPECALGSSDSGGAFSCQILQKRISVEDLDFTPPAAKKRKLSKTESEGHD